MKAKRKTTTGPLDWNVMNGLAQRLLQDKLYRDYLLIFVNSHFGLRISDLLSLRYTDVIDKTELLLVEQKTGKQRKITINPKVSAAIKHCAGILQQQDKYHPEQYIFANRWGGKITISYVNKRLKYILNKYGVSVQNPSSHLLRKTFGMQAWRVSGQSDAAILYLAEIFSHSSTSVTRKYIGINEQVIADVYLNL